MGIFVSVYRCSDGDFTLGGISKTAKDLCIINVPGPFSPDALRPAALLVKGNLRGHVKIVPVDENGKQVKEWVMFGGNYADTSDSRFHEAIRSITGDEFTCGAVPIHDRIER